MSVGDLIPIQSPLALDSRVARTYCRGQLRMEACSEPERSGGRGRVAGAGALTVVAALVALGSAPATSAAAPAPHRKRIETVVRSSAPDARRIAESYVRLYAPLPASVP